MKICIHRGTQEIGGTCIEMEAQGKRIVLDVGLPLDADETKDIKDLLPNVSGFAEKDETLLAAAISHPHQDHYGLARYIRPDIPVMIGKSANDILKAASKFVPDGKYFSNTIYYESWKPTEIGPFTITPYLMDHSAYDAYALLIEADNKRVFYSGDFRGHGRKEKLFDHILKNPPKNIDVLLMEGTTVSREGTEIGFPTEQDLEQKFIEDIKKTKGIYLVNASAQNIDRIVTIYKSAIQNGRKMVIDLYTALVLEATGNAKIPQSYWDDVRVFIPQRQRIQIKKQEYFDDVKRHRVNRIFPEDLAKNPSKFVMIFRPWMREDIDRMGCADGAGFAYSMWGGYLGQPENNAFLEWLDERGIPMAKIHTSGHAPLADLKRFAKAINPKKLIPIHSFETESFGDHFDNVENRNDGEWWGV